MKAFLLFVLLLGAPVGAQTLAITGGSGNLYDNGMNSTGVDASLYLPSSTISGGIGWGAGRMQFSLADTFKWRGDLVIVGSQEFGFGFNGVGLGLAFEGLAVTKKSADFDMTLFAGMTGLGFNTPFISSVTPQHVGAGVYLRRKLRHVQLYNLDALAAKQSTVAVGASLLYSEKLTASISGGWVDGREFFEGYASYRPFRQLSLSASHNDYFQPYHATGNSVSASVSEGLWTAQASLNESTSRGVTVTGQSIGGGVKVGPIAEQVTYYKSGTVSMVNSNSTETFHHLILNQSIGRSSTTSYAFGGGWSSNRFSVAVNHSIVFVLNGEGFQQVTGITLSARIPGTDISINGGTVTTPYGKTLWNSYATDYLQVGDAVPGQITRASVGGKYTISGTVRDAKGDPVSGAAIEVGKIIAFSNSQGQWSVRVKKTQDQAILVIPTIFATPGNWLVKSAPPDARPGVPADVVVERQ